eukprot:GEMP01088883.1.p1 GENE.GEMP01088883.1~~GEMP01088883.1.p1  ORF type:complete len:252 (+),score=79.93 GEMP01088883.1:45-800(+)
MQGGGHASQPEENRSPIIGDGEFLRDGEMESLSPTQVRQVFVPPPVTHSSEVVAIPHTVAVRMNALIQSQRENIGFLRGCIQQYHDPAMDAREEKAKANVEKYRGELEEGRDAARDLEEDIERIEKQAAFYRDTIERAREHPEVPSLLYDIQADRFYDPTTRAPQFEDYPPLASTWKGGKGGKQGAPQANEEEERAWEEGSGDGEQGEVGGSKAQLDRKHDGALIFEPARSPPLAETWKTAGFSCYVPRLL